MEIEDYQANIRCYETFTNIGGKVICCQNFQSSDKIDPRIQAYFDGVRDGKVLDIWSRSDNTQPAVSSAPHFLTVLNSKVGPRLWTYLIPVEKGFIEVTRGADSFPTEYQRLFCAGEAAVVDVTCVHGEEYPDLGS
jgi:hypothetical protein